MVKLKLCGVVMLLLICTFTTQLHAQTSENSMSMTLDECLEYARDNSITLQKAKLDIDDSKADQVSAKGAFLPTVSGSIAQDVVSYPFQNTSSSSSYYSGSYGLDLSLNLYNGGKNRALLQQSEVNINIADLEYDEYLNSIEVSITEVYIEILYAMEQIKVAKNSLEVGIKTENRGRTLLEVGSINAVELAQLESATASYRYDLISAEATLSTLYVQLKQLLEISQEMTLTVREPEITENLSTITIPSVSEVYNDALIYRPEIQSTRLSIESAELSETIAKSGYLPTLSLSAGTGVNHNSSSSYTFSCQIRNNFNTSAGLRLSIPIFSNYYNKTAVRKAQNSIKTANLNLTEVEKNLYQTIEALHNNATTTQAKYSVSEVQLEATKKSLDLTREQYEVKMKTVLELLTEQDNYNQAYQEYLVNKYQFLYNKALLNYYKTDIIKL